MAPMYKTPIPGQDVSKMEFIRWRFDEITSYEAILESLSDIVYEGQKPFNPTLSRDICRESVDAVLAKREIQHALGTAINLDVLCENNQLLGPIQHAVWEDRGTFGMDEVFISVAQIYGSIGVSNAYALDRMKPGIIREVDQLGKTSEFCHTFLDDMLCVIAGAAMGRIAHTMDQGNILL